MVINVGRAPSDRRLIDALGSTISSVFPAIYIVDIPGSYNSIIFATNQPTQVRNLAANLVALLKKGNVPSLLIESIQTAVSNLQPVPQKSSVFTDDLAPIEWITNNMLSEFYFFRRSGIH